GYGYGVALQRCRQPSLAHPPIELGERGRIRAGISIGVAEEKRVQRVQRIERSRLLEMSDRFPDTSDLQKERALQEPGVHRRAVFLRQVRKTDLVDPIVERGGVAPVAAADAELSVPKQNVQRCRRQRSSTIGRFRRETSPFRGTLRQI